MSDFAKTSLYVAVAAALLIVAFISQPQSTFTPSTFDDTGEQFFPDFDDPLDATAMEVFQYDDETGQPDVFRVEYKDNRWTIPSHYNYPADARDRLAKTAGALIGLTKDAVVSDNPEEHADLGVVDPNESGAASKGWGTRVKLFDKGGNAVVDLIVGKDVEDHAGFKYMRVPGTDRVYRAKADQLDLSIKFIDWIDTDLLELSSVDVSKLTQSGYKVDLEQGRIIPGKPTVLRKNEESKWEVAEIEPPLSENEELNESKVRDMASTVADLKIVGVREKPEGLQPDLSLPQIVQAALQQQMAARGFYVTKQGLYSNDGEVLVETDDGLVYTLRFGGVIVGQGDEVTAGAEDEKVADEEKKDAQAKEEEKDEENKADENKSNVQRSRFLLVSVDFNEDRFPPIPDSEPAKTEEARVEKETEAETEEAAKEKSDEQSEAKKAEEKQAEEKQAEEKQAEEKKADEKKDAEAKAAEEEKKKQEEELKRKREEREKKIKEGKEKAKELSERYARWYYLIPNESFEKIMLARADLVKEKEKKEEDATSTPSLPESTPPAPEKTEEKAEPKAASEAAKPAEKKEADSKEEKAEKVEAKPADKAEQPAEKAEEKPAPAKTEEPTKAEEKPAPAKAEEPAKTEEAPKSEAKPDAPKDAEKPE